MKPSESKYHLSPKLPPDLVQRFNTTSLPCPRTHTPNCKAGVILPSSNTDHFCRKGVLHSTASRPEPSNRSARHMPLIFRAVPRLKICPVFPNSHLALLSFTPP